MMPSRSRRFSILSTQHMLPNTLEQAMQQALKICLLLSLTMFLSGCNTTGSPWKYNRSNKPTAQAEPSRLSDVLSRVMGTSSQNQPYYQGQNQNGQNNATGTNGNYGRRTQSQIESSSLPYDSDPMLNNALSSAHGPIKVALLLPLSGEHSRLGKAMMNAANMALFDIDLPMFELLPRDTKGTPEGAQLAAQDALQNGAQLILGPVFSPNVRAVKNVVNRTNVNVIAFSTDWRMADNQTFVMGFLPFDQIERVMSHAAYNDIKSIGVLIPDNEYGNVVLPAYQAMARQYGLETVNTYRFDPSSPNLTPDLRAFTRYDERVELVNQEIRPLEAYLKQYPDNEKAKKELEELQTSAIFETSPYDAVFMPVGGDQARAIANLLSHYDLPPSIVRRIGLGLLDDPGLTAEPSLEGAWFAAPSPKSLSVFNTRFKNTYGSRPPRLASLAYDATALAAILTKNGLVQTGFPHFDSQSIANPNGFAGVDGIFRFGNNGLIERGLSVLQYKRGDITEVVSAPATFQSY